jgi:hypothetical protein
MNPPNWDEVQRSDRTDYQLILCTVPPSPRLSTLLSCLSSSSSFPAPMIRRKRRNEGGGSCEERHTSGSSTDIRFLLSAPTHLKIRTGLMTPPTEFSGVSTPRYFTSAHSYIIRETCPEDDGLNETNRQRFPDNHKFS